VNKHWGKKETVGFLNRLRETIRKTVEQEQEFHQTSQARLSREKRKYQTDLESLNNRLSDSLQRAEADHCTTKERLHSRYEQRVGRIEKAKETSLACRLKSIEDEEGRQKYEVQKNALQAERTRDNERNQAEKTFNDYSNQTAEDNQQLSDLTEKTRGAFRGFRKFARLLSDPRSLPEVDPNLNEYQLKEKFDQELSQLLLELNRFTRLPFPFLFRFVPLWLWILIVILVRVSLVWLLPDSGFDSLNPSGIDGAFIGVIIGLIGVHELIQFAHREIAARMARLLSGCRLALESGFQKSDVRLHQDSERIQQEFDATTARLKTQWDEALAAGSRQRELAEPEIRSKADRAVAIHKRQFEQRHQEQEQSDPAHIHKLKVSAERERSGLSAIHQAAAREMQKELDGDRQTLTDKWKQRLEPILKDLSQSRTEAGTTFLPWDSAEWKNWNPPTELNPAAPFARLEVDLEITPDLQKELPDLNLADLTRISLPLCLTFPDQGSLLFETGETGRTEAIENLNQTVLRLLTVSPAGRLKFTLIDPVELGQNFAGIMHLTDSDPALINHRIWTQTSQIEQKLADVNEHMEKVIQMYLRNEYSTISEYNQQAGNIAEKYHFLVVADFPQNFSDLALRRLTSLAAGGARCGIYLLIHWDHRIPGLQEFPVDDFRKSCVSLISQKGGFALNEPSTGGIRIILDSSPNPQMATDLIHRIGQLSVDAERVKVPFDAVKPQANDIWSLETARELRVAIGRSGATKLQYLSLGKDTRQHVLVAGKTGSGKSTLFHVIITNLSLWCNPNQVEFYLIDFKKGVEFKCYSSKGLPHADREFGLSVLRRVDEELKRRGELFRDLGVQNLDAYHRTDAAKPLPRSLLMIDEFQEFFVEEDRISQNAALLLDRIVRQGRAFGIHVILGSQTLGGAYTLARTTLGQMVIRIALQCNETDAGLIMNEENPAPRLLSRPGEGIYNDSAGTINGNSPFQTVWLSDEQRDACLDRILLQSESTDVEWAKPIVFEGNVPALVDDNAELRVQLNSEKREASDSLIAWLGSPNSIKGSTRAVFKSQSGNHLLIVGQNDESIPATISTAMISIASQSSQQAVQFFFLDGSPPESPASVLLDQVLAAIPQKTIRVQTKDLAETMGQINDELDRRNNKSSDRNEPVIFLVVHGLQKFPKLRYEDDFSFSLDDEGTSGNPGAQFHRIICEGAAQGIHIIAACDTYNNINRCLNRKALSEFEMRMLLQMSASDSANLTDSGDASKLGIHKALFYNEQEAYLETFRPYAPPKADWLKHVARKLENRA